MLGEEGERKEVEGGKSEKDVTMIIIHVYTTDQIQGITRLRFDRADASF